MSRVLLLNRAVALHRPRPATLSLRPFSTSKPSKGDKEKRQRASKNFDSPGASSPSAATTFRQNTRQTKKKRGRPSKKGEGPPILIPPGKKQTFASLPNPPFDRSHSTENDESFFHHDTWTANVSPFLDPQDFCKRSAFYEDSPSRNGTLAARRLLQGKEEVLEKLQENILDYNRRRNKNVKPRKERSFAIVGHGVPNQLLQAHVDMADFLLRKYKDAEGIHFINSIGELSFEKMRVVDAPPPMNKSRLEPWPFEKYSKWDDQMLLYLTVMNRISTTLSDVLWRDAPVPAIEKEEEEDDDFIRTSSSSAARPHGWTATLHRGTKYPSEAMLTPIVEWTLPEKKLYDSKGYVTIRLRGQPSRLLKPTSSKRSKRQKAPLEVTLTFCACFENPLKEK